MRILIADDHHLVRDSLKAYIEAQDEGTRVVPAATLAEALQQAPPGKPFDVILLDLDMPGMSGFAGFERMREARPDVPVAIISGLIDPDRIIEALDRGAAGFIPKTLSGNALLNALRLIASGETYVPALLVSQLREGRGLGSGRPSPLGKLSPIETQILKLLAKGQSNKEIGQALELEEYTVKYHLRSIFRKLEVGNRTKAVRRAIDLGLPVDKT